MNQSNFSIMYAEDDDKIRAGYIRLFKQYFKNVYEAKDGKEALDIYNKHKPDVAVLDINMPKINGLKLARQIREDNKNIKLVMLTAYSDTDKLLDAIELSLSKYLIKPINTQELIDLIQNCIIELQEKNTFTNNVFIEGGFRWDIDKKEIFDKNNNQIALTKKEIELLDLFCNNKNATFSNEDILNSVWEDDLNDNNANKLRILLSKLKTKLSYNIFNSIYNVGYKLKLENN